MRKHYVRRVLDWRRSGYPEGIPDKDHFALLAVLRRRLTDDEIDELVALSMELAHETPDRHIDYDRVRALVARKIHQEPSDKDMKRVSQRLASGGWPGTDGPESPSGETEQSMAETEQSATEAEHSTADVDGARESE